MPAAALALDLGTTALKGGLIGGDGEWRRRESWPAPELSGSGGIRESDPRAWLGAAARALRELARGASGAPLGLTAQRSSFLLWEKISGRPLTPLIGWQDRRAADWCGQKRDQFAALGAKGLPLSPHYAGPKLAGLLEAHPDWRAGMAVGRILFGTLESWLLWHWAGGAMHCTDLSMAARTLLADPEAGDWDPARLGFFGVPRAGLPEIFPSVHRAIPLRDGPVFRASLGDQPAALLAAARGGDALVNLGTGVFVQRATGADFSPSPGLLAGPILGGLQPLFASEGPVNGGADALAGLRPPERWPAEDPAPEGFCIPDAAGLGAPHWRPEIGLTFAAPPADDAAKARLICEGLVFRVHELIAALFPDESPKRVLVTGGLSRSPLIAQGLAALGHPVFAGDLPDASLTGAARLAADLPLPAPAQWTPVSVDGHYLRDKFPRWKARVSAMLGDKKSSR